MSYYAHNPQKSFSNLSNLTQHSCFSKQNPTIAEAIMGKNYNILKILIELLFLDYPQNFISARAANLDEIHSCGEIFHLQCTACGSVALGADCTTAGGVVYRYAGYRFGRLDVDHIGGRPLKIVHNLRGSCSDATDLLQIKKNSTMLSHNAVVSIILRDLKILFRDNQVRINQNYTYQNLTL